jgi:uncharacterized protein YacL
MNNLKNLIDTSNVSLGIAAVVFIITIIITKYILEYYDSNSANKREINVTMFYSLIIALLVSAISLVIMKQVKFSDSGILTNPFPTSAVKTN